MATRQYGRSGKLSSERRGRSTAQTKYRATVSDPREQVDIGPPGSDNPSSPAAVVLKLPETAKQVVTQGFAISLPPAGVLPYFKLYTQSHTAGTGNSTLLCDIAVPTSLYFVVNRIVFRAFDPTLSGGTTGFLGVTNPALYTPSLAWELSGDFVTSPGEFGVTLQGSSLYSGFPYINVNVAEAIGWDAALSYGLVVRPNGHFMARVRQVRSIDAPNVTPTDLGVEVGGFFADPDYVETYLRNQARTTR